MCGQATRATKQHRQPPWWADLAAAPPRVSGSTRLSPGNARNAPGKLRPDPTAPPDGQNGRDLQTIVCVLKRFIFSFFYKTVGLV